MNKNIYTKSTPINQPDQNKIESSSNELQHKRRLQDEFNQKHKSHKVNLDRRIKHNERRENSNFFYMGVAQRLTIDRRLNFVDRRHAQNT